VCCCVFAFSCAVIFGWTSRDSTKSLPPPAFFQQRGDPSNTMANPYYNTGTTHTDYSQGHSMPQGPFQQSHQSQSATQHLPVYQHSPYAVHPSLPHAHTGYSTSGDHGVLQYPPTIHHAPGAGRWVGMETDEELLNKYRPDDPEPDYEMDHQSQDHPQQQQHLQSMQAPPTASHESQAHATLQPHTPMTSLPSQPEQMSPATRPGVVRTGALFCKNFPTAIFVTATRKLTWRF